MTLTARFPVLYRSVQYEAGDPLPADNSAMVEAWLETGAAFWLDNEAVKEAPKAKPATAQAGLPGKSSDGDPEALVGRVPDKPERKRSRKKT